jgi:hypothetical protein
MVIVFGSWICVTDSSGGFNDHLADSREPETSAATERSDLEEFIDNLDETLLPDLAREIEEESVLDVISTRATPKTSWVGFKPIWGRAYPTSIRATQRGSCLPGVHAIRTLSNLEEDLDRLLKIGEEGATASREAPVFRHVLGLGCRL